VIGILSQALTTDMRANASFAGKTSFISKSYVDWLEKAGAKVVPLRFDDDYEAIKATIGKVYGLLYMGGSESNQTYIDFGGKVYDYVKQINDNGTSLPMWGTSLGFQYFGRYASTNKTSVVTAHEAEDISLNLTFF
jgi:gamma-glutamyl hydrolase